MVTTEPRMSVASLTDVGGRQNNEDAVLALEIPVVGASGAPSWILAVADGMGGHENGEVASRIAIETLQQTFADGAPDDTALALKQAYRRANAAIFEQAGGDANPKRMGTTLVTAIVRGKYVTIANVGDSRAYLMRANQMTQITMDHSLVSEQVQQGLLTPEEARHSRERNILTQTLGTNAQLDRKMPSVFEIALLPEDRLLLCSDGFYDVMSDNDMLGVLADTDTADAPNALAVLANERGTTDNVSAVVLAVGESNATIQRQEIAREIAEQRGDNAGTSVIIPAIVLLVVILAIAAGVYFFL